MHADSDHPSASEDDGNSAVQIILLFGDPGAGRAFIKPAGIRLNQGYQHNINTAFHRCLSGKKGLFNPDYPEAPEGFQELPPRRPE
jgi:hypothetical protein